MADDLATYHSTKRVKAGEIIRVQAASCVVRTADGGELWVPLDRDVAENCARPGYFYIDLDHGEAAFCPPEHFPKLYVSRAGNL